MRKAGIYILLVVLLSLGLRGQSENYILNKQFYSYQNGLPGKVITCCVQDKFGYLWFGTNNGLARFNGEQFEVFTPKSHGLRERYINHMLLDDSCGIILVYSEQNSPNVNIRKYDVIDFTTFDVKPITHYYPGIPFVEERISFIGKETSTNNLLFFLDESYIFNPALFLINPVWRYNRHRGFTSKKFEILKTVEFNSGKGGQLEVTPYHEGEDLRDKAFLIFNDSSMYYAANHTGTTIFDFKNSNSVYEVINPTTKKAYHYLIDRKALNFFPIAIDSSKLYRDIIAALGTGNSPAVVPNNTFYWKDHDLFLYNLEFGSIRILNKQEDGEPQTLINYTFEDKHGAIWLCLSNGLLKLNIKKNRFKKHFTFSQSKRGFNHSAREILKCGDTLMAGINSYLGIACGTDTSYIQNDVNFSLLKEGDSLWVGSFNLSVFNFRTQKINARGHSPFGEIWSMCRIKPGYLILGTTKSLVCFDEASNSFTEVAHHTFPTPTLTYKLFKNREGFWMAVSNKGLYQLNEQGTGVTDLYSSFSADAHKRLPFEGLNDALQDSLGNYWLASVNDGLFYWDIKANTFEQYGTESGFVSLTTYRLCFGNYGELWISTEFGLVRFNIKTKIAKVYTRKDGLHNNEFNRASGFKDALGHIYFGCQDGIIEFKPSDFNEAYARNSFPLLIEKITCFNTQLGVEETLNRGMQIPTAILLTDHHQNLKINFAFLDYNEQRNNYAYKLLGLDTNWIYISQPQLQLNDIPYGSFTLSIKAQCEDGTWNKEQIALALVMQKPFYKTWWFALTVIFASLLMIGVAFKYRISLLKKQNAKLEQTVEHRTSELQSSLAEQTALLQEVHHRVKNNLQFITAIIEMQRKTLTDKLSQASLREISRRIHAMSLVHEMLYKKDKLEFVQLDAYLQELTARLQEIMSDDVVVVDLLLDIEKQLRLDINNSVAFGLIISELFSNSLKHAFASTPSPKVEINIYYDQTLPGIIVNYQDNGKGMDADNTASGLGLRLISIFARQLQSTYSIRSGEGLSFLLKMPYTHE